MKILHICGNMRIGGAERAIFQLVKAQRHVGKQADILTTDRQSYYSNEVSRLGASVHCIGQKGGAHFGGVREFLELARQYDVIHFHTTNPALMLASFLLGQNQKLFYTHRGGDHQFPLRRYLSFKVSGFCVKRKFSGVSGNTCRAARSMAKLFGISEDVVKITYNGIYFDLLAPRRTADEVLSDLRLPSRCKFLVGTTATLRQWKRIDLLLRAVAQIPDQAVHCIIVGDGPERLSLERLAEALRISDRVMFVGRKEYVGDYLNVLDVFILPSNEGESFGNSVVEAMSFGIPTLVMADGGGVLEHIPEGTDLVAKDSADLARIIIRILADPTCGRKLGAVCSTYVREKYTVEKMRDGYDRLYEDGWGQGN